MSVSVNVSAVQLERDRVIDDVHRVLEATGIDPSSLILELTESALMQDVDATLTRLKLLKALGVRLAIDDFGTGYSSLSHLRQLPIDVLKIDQSFVSGMADSTESAAIVHTLIQLGKVLGLTTVAEGVESNEQREFLKAEGVNIGQGYLFSKPLGVSEVEEAFRIPICQVSTCWDLELGRIHRVSSNLGVLAARADRLRGVVEVFHRAGGTQKLRTTAQRLRYAI